MNGEKEDGAKDDSSQQKYSTIKNCCPICGHEFEPVQETNTCPNCGEVTAAENLITEDDDYVWTM